MIQGGLRKAWRGTTRLSVEKAGFTILEVMIVLVVTGVLFISAVVLINGRQNRTQFQVAINLVQQQIQQIINETNNGYFPKDTAYTCARGVAGPPVLTAVASGDHQGTNSGCLFLGKVIQFKAGNADPQIYATFPIVGNRLDGSGNEASDLYGAVGALPIAAAKGDNTNLTITAGPQETVLTGGLQVVSMWYGSNPLSNVGAVGFITSLPGGSGYYGADAQHLNLYVITGSMPGQTETQMADYIYSGYHSSTPLYGVDVVSICFASGTTNQSGKVVIGNTTNGSMVVKLTIFNGTTC